MTQSGIFFKTLSMWPCSRFILSNSFSKIQLNANSITSIARTRLKELNIPEKPKKPATPYIRFIKENQAVIAKNHPNWKQSEIFKKCAEQWKTISVEKKQDFEDTYKIEKQQYDQAILAFQASLTNEQVEAIKNAAAEKKKSKQLREKRKILKDTKKPKRPSAPYMLYIIEQSKMRNMSLKDLMKEYKNKWATLEKNEKEKYITQFLKQKQLYEAEMKIWEDKMIKEGHVDLVRTKSLPDTRPSRIKQMKLETSKQK